MLCHWVPRMAVKKSDLSDPGLAVEVHTRWMRGQCSLYASSLLAVILKYELI